MTVEFVGGSYRELAEDPLADVDSVANWLAWQCDGKKPQLCIGQRDRWADLSETSTATLLHIALSDGELDVVRGRAMSVLADRYKQSLEAQ